MRDLLHRKGSPETFDAAGFVHLMRRLANLESDVFIPAFDRKKDISIPCSDVVSANDRILIVEGNQLFIKGTPWVELQEIRDETIFINTGVEIIKKAVN